MFLKKLKLNAMKDYDMSNISCLSKEISNLDLKIELNNQTIEAMQQAVHAIDTDSVKLFYNEASSYLPNIQKKFTDLINFHEKMTSNKIAFIEAGVVKLNKERRNKNALLEEELLKFNTEMKNNVKALKSANVNNIEVRLQNRSNGNLESIQSFKEVALPLKKPDLIGQSPWEFLYEGKVIAVVVNDQSFLSRIHNHAITTLYAGVKVPCLLKMQHDCMTNTTQYSILKVTGDIIEPKAGSAS